MATAQPVHDRLRDTVSRLVHRGLGVEDYWRAVSDALAGVQDHLKSIFSKTGTGSRGDLVARLFFDHYAPRLSAGAAAGPDGPTAHSSN